MTRAKKLKQRKEVVGFDQFGRPIRKSFYGHTDKEVKKKIEIYKAELENEFKKQERVKRIFRDYLDYWLENYIEGAVSPRTYTGTYVCMVHCLQDELGDYTLDQLTPDVLQKFFNRISCSESKMNKLYMICRRSLAMAYNLDFIDKNPMDFVKKGTCKPPKKKNIYADDNFRIVLEYAKQHPYGIGAFVMLKAGVRVGELCALEPDKHINFKNRQLIIKNGVTLENGVWVIKGPKTHNSIRAVPLDDEFFNTIKDYLKNRPFKDKFLIGRGKNEIISPDSYRRVEYKKFLRDLMEEYPQLGTTTPHGLRHSFGTTYRHAGADLDTIAKLMGHSDIRITSKFYISDSAEDVRNRLKKIVIP